MATTAQIAANRTNAQASTGPKTAEGKAKSSQNAVSLGLFTKQNCVQPEEREEYHNLYNALWRDLSPIGAMEELFATEIIRGAWRLRRCAMVEATLASYASQKNRAAHEEDNGKDVPYRGTCDPMIYDYTAGTQVAVDRARTQAAGAMRRATADLRRLQTERLFRAATLPENADASRFGLASFEEVVPKLHNEAKAQLLAVITEPAEGHAAISRVAEVTNRTESPAATAMPKTEVSHHRPAEVTEILKSAAWNKEAQAVPEEGLRPLDLSQLNIPAFGSREPGIQARGGSGHGGEDVDLGIALAATLRAQAKVEAATKK